MTLRVSALYSYPIKGCAGVTVDATTMTEAGLLHDRSFMVIGADGRGYTQRGWPRLARIHPRVSADGGRLRLSTPGSGSIDVDIKPDGQRRAVELFGASYRGIDQGPAVAEWLSGTLGVHCRLVRVPPEHDRVTDGQTEGTSGYADSCAVHIVSEDSWNALNRRLVVGGFTPVPMERFRPNVVITGGEPHIEDKLRQLRIGTTDLGYAKLAIRCVVTTVDQTSGAKSGPEPLRTLAGYRRSPEKGIAFGAKFAVTRTGELTVGDELTEVVWGVSEMNG